MLARDEPAMEHFEIGGAGDVVEEVVDVHGDLIFALDRLRKQKNNATLQ